MVDNRGDIQVSVGNPDVLLCVVSLRPGWSNISFMRSSVAAVLNVSLNVLATVVHSLFHKKIANDETDSVEDSAPILVVSFITMENIPKSTASPNHR